MTNSIHFKTIKYLFCFLFLFNFTFMNAQVGIGTTNPALSSVLEVASTTQGMLTPRMTTAQKNAIVSPANGLMVFDTDLKSFYYYDSSITSWNKVFSSIEGRLKFKLIKSTDVLATVLAAELSAGGGTKYLLDATTLYEINGTVLFNLPIDLNNAYLTGLDSSEDKIIKTGGGDLFIGSTGGTIRILTLVAPTSGNLFNILGTGAVGTNTQTLILRDCIVASSFNVGKIENIGLVFISIVNYALNTNGIIYKDIGKLLISNAGWLGDNGGTYEKIEGTFGLIAKQGGFSEVIGTKIGFDVSANPTITGDAVFEGTVFSGTLTTGKYVNGYTPTVYTGFNFNNSWIVRCAGIPTETDSEAVGDINFDYPVGSGALTNVTGTGNASRIKLAGLTTSNNLFRFSRGGLDNRLVYLGKKKRFITASGSLSYQSNTNPATFILYIAKNGVVINQSKIYSAVLSGGDIATASVSTIVEMTTNDYVEFWVEKFAPNPPVNILITSLNLVLR